MAITIGCLNAPEYGMIAGCCCSVTCSISSDNPNGNILDGISFGNKDFTVSDITIDGNPPRFPYIIDFANPAEISFKICAPSSIVSQSFEVYFTYDGGQIASVSTTLTSILNNLFSVSLLDFGTIGVNQSTGIQIDLNSNLPPLLCCVDCSFGRIDAPFSTSFTSTTLCNSMPQSIQLYFEPTSVGTFNGYVYLIADCSRIALPLTGIAEEITPGGNNVSGIKRTVVDCPSGDCKLFNPQPGFSQKTKNSINQISRFTAPKGGPGRGTNFRK